MASTATIFMTLGHLVCFMYIFLKEMYPIGKQIWNSYILETKWV